MLPSTNPKRLVRNALSALAITLAVAGAAQAQSYVNLTAGGAFAPGVYGQISLGNNLPPPVWNAQPVIVGAPVYGAPLMYLHVAPAEYRDWSRYCGRYRACGRPVHFVRVEENNRWWNHHNEHLRGESYYRRPPARWSEHRGSHREEQHDNRRNRRDEHRRGDRDDNRH